MPWNRRIGLSALLTAIIAAIGWGFWPRPVLVDTAPVTTGPLVITVQEEGKTRVIDRFVVSAPVAGFARRIEMDVGDEVKKNQNLVRLEPLKAEVLDPRSRAEATARVEGARSALRAAEENIEAAKADADYARAEHRRRKELSAKSLVTREELDRAQSMKRRNEARLRSATFAVEVARFDLDAARTALKYSAAQELGAPHETVAVYAPVAGEVLRIHHESEGVVDAGAPLLEIGNPRALEVEVDVLSADAVRIAPETHVLFHRWGGEAPLQGIVRVVEPTGFTKISALGVEEQRVLVISDITSPPQQWARLGDGYRVEASFVVWQAQDVRQIPTSALFRLGEAWAVFTIEGGRAKAQTVDVGKQSALTAQIIAGLGNEETVIVHPNDAIEDKTRVQPRQNP